MMMVTSDPHVMALQRVPGHELVMECSCVFIATLVGLGAYAAPESKNKKTPGHGIHGTHIHGTPPSLYVGSGYGKACHLPLPRAQEPAVFCCATSGGLLDSVFKPKGAAEPGTGSCAVQHHGGGVRTYATEPGGGSCARRCLGMGGGGESIHHALKETTCEAMPNLHARPAFGSSSEAVTANLPGHGGHDVRLCNDQHGPVPIPDSISSTGNSIQHLSFEPVHRGGGGGGWVPSCLSAEQLCPHARCGARWPSTPPLRTTGCHMVQHIEGKDTPVTWADTTVVVTQ